MIMHGTWYKGPQLAHPHSHTEYHQYRSYPSFVVTPYHDGSSSSSVVTAAAAAALTNSTAPCAPSGPILVEGSFTATGIQSSNSLTTLSPTIKIEQNYSDHQHQPLHQHQQSQQAEQTLNDVEDYALNGLDCSIVDNTTFKKPTNYVWPSANSESETNNNTIPGRTHITNPATPPTPPPDTHLNLDHTSKSYSSSLKRIEESELIEQQQQQQHQEITQSHKSLKHKQTPATSSSLENHLGNGSNMPIGGVQGQNPTQGLVHWMSAVMAEHMTGQTHHDPTGVGMHYMWNGNMDAKMNDHHNNLQKGHFIDDNRLEHHAVTPQGGSVLGSAGGGHHGNHVGHHSSASAAALLVVPQPINATKIGSSLGGSGGGGGTTGRKYQCKMCPQMPSTQQQWVEVASKFDLLWNFPNCIGAVDGKHVNIIAPQKSGSTFYNYKCFHSIVLMAVVDAEYKYLYIDVGSNGRISDGGVFSKCSFQQALDNSGLNLATPRPLPGREVSVPFVLVADDAFRMQNNLLKPYPGRSLSAGQRIFNYRLSRARRIVENVFGIMTKRFEVFSRPIKLNANKSTRVTLACCALHNFLVTKNPKYTESLVDRFDAHGILVSGARANDFLPTVEHATEELPSSYICKEVKAIRQEYENYFMSPTGELSWQYKLL